jgi:uncharacterized protein
MSAIAPAPERVFRLAVVPVRNVVVRDASGTGDGSWTVEGYAAVYEQETTLWDGRWFQMAEELARGAFTNVLERVSRGDELVHLNHGHDMKTAVAATDVSGIGGLELEEDFHGLRFFARVNTNDPDVQRLVPKMQRGIVRQSSFAFTIASEELAESGETDDGKLYEKWRITEIGHLYDVCVCAQGAYQQTESYLRSLAAASLGRAGLDPAGLDRRTGSEPVGGTPPVATEPEERADEPAPVPEGSQGSDPARERRLAQLRAQAQTLVSDHARRTR